MIQKQISKIHHSERCTKCKEVVKELLEKIYGKVNENYNFEIDLSLEEFKNTIYYDKLQEIYRHLQNYRGFKEFIKAKHLPNCDFFVENPRFIVEFDESQHFTLLRKLVLEHYPEELKLGFDRRKWIRLCEMIHARDNDPPYRDEQRAWYDTLRDFLPTIKNLNPTIRIFSKDFIWCSLNPNNPSDIHKFKYILKERSDTLKEKPSSFKFEIKEDNNPFLARIIIAGQWNGGQNDVKKLLNQVYKNWPKGRKVKFIITCGGFIQFDWPESVSRTDVGDNKYPNNHVVDLLVKKAEECIKFILNEGLGDKLKEITDYITLGIDSHKEKISTTQNYINQLHIELVVLVDLRKNKFYWTGKSYPTDKQQKGLVRISALNTHFFNFEDIGKIMVLGCHDFNILINRGKKVDNITWKKNIRKEFQELAKKENPTYVLQHPHTTESTRTWSAALGATKKLLSTVKLFASAGRFFKTSSKYSDLDKVLEKTKIGPVIDFIIHAN